MAKTVDFDKDVWKNDEEDKTFELEETVDMKNMETKIRMDREAMPKAEEEMYG